MEQFCAGVYNMLAQLLCCFLLQFFALVSAVNAGCECIVFEETYGKEFGVFTSPNWPTPYVSLITPLIQFIIVFCFPF